MASPVHHTEMERRPQRGRGRVLLTWWTCLLYTCLTCGKRLANRTSQPHADYMALTNIGIRLQLHPPEKLHTANNSTLVSGQQTLNFEKSIGLEHGQQNSSNITYSPVIKRGWETDIGQKIAVWMGTSAVNGGFFPAPLLKPEGTFVDPQKSACFLNRWGNLSIEDLVCG